MEKNTIIKQTFKWGQLLYFINALVFCLLVTSNYGLDNALYYTVVGLLAIFLLKKNALKSLCIFLIAIFSLSKIPYLALTTIISVKALLVMFLIKNSLSTTFWIVFPIACLLPTYGIFITSLGVIFSKQHIQFNIKYPKTIIVLLFVLPSILPFDGLLPKQNEVVSDLYLEVANEGILLTDMNKDEQTLFITLMKGIARRDPDLIEDALFKFTTREKILLIKDKVTTVLTDKIEKIKEKGSGVIDKFKKEDN